MATERKVAVLVGSLRKESFNRKLVNAAIAQAPENLKFDFLDIGHLPYYNQDDEAQAPASWVAFRDQIRAHDAMLFVTPEYNRGVPATIKNAIDVGSRPPGKNVFDGKPAAVMSASAGALGGYGANQHLRDSITVLNMPLMTSPDVFIPAAGNLLTADGQVNNDATRDLLKRFITAFASWIEKHAS